MIIGLVFACPLNRDCSRPEKKDCGEKIKEVNGNADKNNERCME